MASHKNQHFIPRCYLKAWCDPLTPSKQTPYVWQFSKDGSQVKKKAPENIFYEKDMYTIVEADGSRNLMLEHGLSGLEKQFSLVRDKTLKHRRKIEPDDHLILCAFAASMDSRTKSRREHEAKQWGRLVEMADKMREKAKTFTPEQMEQARRIMEHEENSYESKFSFGEDEAREIAEKPLQSLLESSISVLTPMLLMMDFVIVETKTSPGFITSDHPCVWVDPEAYKRPPFYRAPALMYESTEISLPISQQQTLVFRRKLAVRGTYVSINDKMVEDLNRRVRFNAYEYFVVNSKVKKDWWFDPGAEREDSWEKLNPKPKYPFEDTD